MEDKIKLGDTVRHIISGAHGIVVGITDWLSNSQRSLSIQSKTQNVDGTPSPVWSCQENEVELEQPW